MDVSIRESGEQFLSQSVPGGGGTLVGFGNFLSLFSWDFSFQNGDGFVVNTHQVPDFDASLGSDGNPLHFWVEGDGVNGGSGIEGSGWLGEI